MELEEKTLGPLPVLAAGNGEPLFYLGGLLPTAGVDSSLARRSAEASARPFIDMRTVIYVNRRSGLTNGTTIAEIAAEHAAAIGALNCGPVDVLGASTGGSIAQQLAADHPETVRRLVLVATGCRLSANARRMQARVAQQIRAGKSQEALASMIVGVIAPGAAPLARVLAPFVSPLVRRVGDLSDLAATIEAEDRFDLARCQGTIAAPTLIVAGARDRIYPPSLREGDTATDPWKRPGDDPQTRAPDSHERPTPRSNGAGVPAASAVEGCLARKARSASGRILASPAGAKQLATNLGRTVRVEAGFAGLGRGRTGSARSTCPTLGRARLMTQAAGAGRSQSRPSRALISARDE